MSINILPVEVLQIILKYLPGAELCKYRDVCVLWKNCIESLGDDYWRTACAQDYPDTYEDSYRKSTITWFQLYESLSLWPKVGSANLKLRCLDTSTRTPKYQLLSNNRLSKCDYEEYDYKTIIYYDLNTLKECQRQHIDFPFRHYFENDNMIILVNERNEICIKVKPGMNSFLVGTLEERALEIKVDLCLLEDTVYFKDKDYNLIICTLTEKNGERVIEARNIGFFHEMLNSVIHVKGQVIILTVEGYVFRLENDELEELCFLSRKMWNNVYRIEKCGFKWSSPAVLNFLLDRIEDEDYDEIPRAIRKFKSPVVCSFGNMVVIATNQCHIHIFETTLKKDLNDGESDSSSSSDSEIEPLDDFFTWSEKKYTAKKHLSINVKDMIEGHLFDSYFRKKIEQLDIVETEKGHKIIFVYLSQVYVLELTHTDSNSTETGESSTPKISTKKSKNNKKSKTTKRKRASVQHKSVKAKKLKKN